MTVVKKNKIDYNTPHKKYIFAYFTGVIMFRLIENDLLAWKTQWPRKPLLVRGARQVGKSYTIEKFGQMHFENIVTINFEFSPQFITCFDNLDPEKIIRCIALLSQQTLIPGKTLLFLDEIQQCPNAIMALRYFKEKLPELHVIGAGSFLEFVINAEAYSQPVGRVQSLYMKPCSWYEYLLAHHDQPLIDYLSTVTPETGIEPAIHAHLLEKCREYFLLGGMPEVIDTFLRTRQFLDCTKIHASILEYYQRDFAKYHQKINTRLLEKIFVKAPSLIAKHVKYTDIDPDIPARDLKPAIDMLYRAGIIAPVYNTTANGLPLLVGVNEKKYKWLFLDIGLAKHALGIAPETLLQTDLMLINQGDLAEQFVGQEWMAYHASYEPSRLFYWEREKKGSQAEVDYVFNIDTRIFPVEVKAGKTGRLKSINVFLTEKKQSVGIHISQNPLLYTKGILSLPFYMIHELPRLLKQLDTTQNQEIIQ